MWTIFSLSNLYFALNVFSSLTLFAVAWLYLDAYRALDQKKELWKVAGFVVLGTAFLFRGMDLTGIVGTNLSEYQSLFKSLDLYIRTLGYLLLVTGLLVDPLQPKPSVSMVFLIAIPSLYFIQPFLAVVVAILYLRRASLGLERHIYPPAFAFFFLAVYETLFSLNLFRETTNLAYFNLLTPFGVVWYLQIIFLAFGIFFLARWVFRYLLKQFESQLFMIQMSLVLAIYLIVTVGFTGLLINNLKNQILLELTSQAKVLDYVFETKRGQLLSDAKLIARQGKVEDDLTHDSVVIFDSDGVVTFRAEDEERKGDSVSGDSLVKKIIEGKEGSNIVVKDGAASPLVYVVSGAPLISDGKVTGGVVVGDIVDNAYLEGFGKLTGLSAAIYGGNILAAGGTLGVKESAKEVKEKVLIKGETLSVESRWLNRSYLSVYSPMKDVDGNTVGMFFVGRPSVDVLSLASRTLEAVFLGTILLLFLSMIPAKLIAISISRQIK